MSVEIWINLACSKCRAARSELEAAGIDYVERRYLKDPPTAAELTAVLGRLGLEPWEIARPVEAEQAGIALARSADHRGAWIAALVTHPRALQRPIITASDGTTVLARDPETVAGVIARETS